jgi:hypothetical protein
MAAAVAVVVLVVGILVGSAGAVLLGRSGDTAAGPWDWMHDRSGAPMMGGSWGMMGGWDGAPLDWMREHMGYGRDSQ